MDPSLIFLSQIRHNLKYADYDLIYKAIHDIPNKPVPIARILQNAYIDRIRINKAEEVFNSINDVGYISKPDIISSLPMGRANKNQQVVFYGALESTEINQPRATCFMETSNIIHSSGLSDSFEGTFTLSRWRVKETFEVIEMIFAKTALDVNPDTRASYEFQLRNLQNEELRQHHIDQLTFFSDEFARSDISSNADYKISAAYINYIWDNTPFKGVTYPSVQSAYKGQNIALLPACVDQYLELEQVAMLKFERRNNENIVGNAFKLVCDFGIDKKNFTWEDVID